MTREWTLCVRAETYEDNSLLLLKEMDRFLYILHCIDYTHEYVQVMYFGL